jgi:succinate dehydrogenase/fumarate reductase cytochrome b subunit
MTEIRDPELMLAFAPVHKRAFGVAVGSALALAVLFMTVASVVLGRGQAELSLLSVYFAGYSVTWVVGFVAGWFTAFARNLLVAIWLLVVRARAELRATRDFLDHI